MREERASQTEADYRYQALCPSVWFRRAVGGAAAQAEEYGVARLHRDKCAEGGVDCAVHEPRDKAADQEEDVGVVRRDLRGEVGVCAL